MSEVQKPGRGGEIPSELLKARLDLKDPGLADTQVERPPTTELGTDVTRIDRRAQGREAERRAAEAQQTRIDREALAQQIAEADEDQLREIRRSLEGPRKPVEKIEHKDATRKAIDALASYEADSYEDTLDLIARVGDLVENNTLSTIRGTGKEQRVEIIDRKNIYAAIDSNILPLKFRKSRVESGESDEELKIDPDKELMGVGFDTRSDLRKMVANVVEQIVKHEVPPGDFSRIIDKKVNAGYERRISELFDRMNDGQMAQQGPKADIAMVRRFVQDTGRIPSEDGKSFMTEDDFEKIYAKIIDADELVGPKTLSRMPEGKTKEILTRQLRLQQQIESYGKYGREEGALRLIQYDTEEAYPPTLSRSSS